MGRLRGDEIKNEIVYLNVFIGWMRGKATKGGSKRVRFYFTASNFAGKESRNRRKKGVKFPDWPCSHLYQSLKKETTKGGERTTVNEFAGRAGNNSREELKRGGDSRFVHFA